MVVYILVAVYIVLLRFPPQPHVLAHSRALARVSLVYIR